MFWWLRQKKPGLIIVITLDNQLKTYFMDLLAAERTESNLEKTEQEVKFQEVKG